MKISRKKFEELVSVYLDNEATPGEKRLLSKCVLRDREMARSCVKKLILEQVYPEKMD